MKTYNTNELIDKLTRQTENILDTVVQQWQMLNPVIIKKQPAPGACLARAGVRRRRRARTRRFSCPCGLSGAAG